jgi:hypothetical protein
MPLKMPVFIRAKDIKHLNHPLLLVWPQDQFKVIRLEVFEYPLHMPSGSAHAFNNGTAQGIRTQTLPRNMVTSWEPMRQ